MSYKLASAENATHRLEIFQDDDPSSPRDWDNAGTFLVWSSGLLTPDPHSYGSFDRFMLEWFGEWQIVQADGEMWTDGFYSEASALAELAEIPTRYSDRIDPTGWTVEQVREGEGAGGICLLIHAGDGHGPFSCYDVTDDPEWANGVIFLTAEKIEKEWVAFPDPTANATIIERATKCLMQEVETYRQYANGEVWGYVCSQRVNVHTVTTNRAGTTTEADSEDWEVTDSCWGFYGDYYGKEVEFLAGEVPEEFSGLVAELS